MPLDISKMNQVAMSILGKHDFSAFCTVASQKENNDCEIFHSEWREEDSLLIYDIIANRFLHSMVRSLVGLMTETGRGEEYLTLSVFKNIMDSGDHTRIKHVAPARGLYLVEVGY